METTIVSTQWLSDHLNDEKIIILDTSPISNKSNLKTEYPGLRIPGARYFDLKNNFSDHESDMPNTLPSPEHFQREARALGIDNQSLIVVYDNLGVYSSPRTWWMFKTMGHDNVAVLNGGLPEWISDGHDTVTDLSKVYPDGNFNAKPNLSLVKNMNDILTNIDNQKATVLDARSSGRFCGTAPEPRKGLSSGHIPNSQSLPFSEVLKNGKFKSKEELIKVFQSKDLNNGPVIFSCGSGLTACITYLAAEIAIDNPKAIYDGSWTEWAQKQEELIVKD